MTQEGDLSKRRIFGCRGELRHSLISTDGNDTFAYVAGHNVVFQALRSKDQSFIQGEDDTRGISAVALSRDGRVLALAQRKDRPFIALWEPKSFRKRKVLQPDEPVGGDVVAMAFSGETDILATLSDEPTHELTLWNWVKGKVASKVQIPTQAPLHTLVFDPQSSVLGAAGDSGLYFYRAKGEGENLQLMPTPDIEPANFTDLIWLTCIEHGCAACTSTGELSIFVSSRPEANLSHPAEDLYTCLLPTSNGFFAAAIGGVYHHFVHKPSHRQRRPERLFEIAATFQVQNCSVGCLSMCLTRDEGTLLAMSEDNQLYKMETISDDLRERSDDDSEARSRGSQGPNDGDKSTSTTSRKSKAARPVTFAFHGKGAVVGLDLCLRKPLCVTIGKDRKIMIWNYMEDTLEQVANSTEDLLSCTFHPNGLHLIVGCADRLRLMNILVDDIRTYYEINIKSCTEVQFSNGGHVFAAVTPGNSICIFDFYTREKLHELRGHNARIQNLSWSENDLYLLSSGSDGAIYQWDAIEGKRVEEFVQKGVVYHGAILTKTSMIACSSDRKLKEINASDFSVSTELDCGVNFSQISLARGGHRLFTGTSMSSDSSTPGSVRVYTYPLAGDYVDYACMAGNVTKMRASYDDQILVVADNAGTICFFDIRERHGGAGISGGVGILPMHATFPWSEEILVTRSDLEDRRNIVEDLVRKVDELEVQNEYQLRMKNMRFGEHMKEITEKFTQELEQDKNRYELLQEEKSDMETENTAKMKQLEEQHEHALQDLESNYQQRIMGEVERFQQAVHERNLQQTKWEEQRTQLIEAHQNYMNELTDDFETKLDEDRQLRIGLEDDLADLQRDLEETKQQLEDDIDTEITNLQGRYEARLAEEKEEMLRLKGENGIMKKKFSVLGKEIEDQKELIKDLQEKETELYAQIENLRQEILSLKREIRSRDDTIGDKERKIYELKKKNQELEKFKFVLDYKIREIKRQIEPREVEIGNMKIQIKKMDQELEQFHKSNASLDLMIGDLRKQLDSMQHEIKKQRKKIHRQNTAISNLKGELHEVVGSIQDPVALHQGIERLLRRYRTEDADAAVEVDEQVAREYERHRDYLEGTMLALKAKFEQGAEEYRSVNVDAMSKNLKLIKEINSQRDRHRNARLQLAAATSQMQHLSHAQSTRYRTDPETSEMVETSRSKRMELETLVDRQRERIGLLERELLELEDRMISGERPATQETLPVQV